MNFFVFIALFGALAQAWQLPWQKTPDSKLFSMNCINRRGHGIVQQSTRKKNNWLRTCWYVILETRINLLAGDRRSWSYVLSSLFRQNALQYYICRRKFKIMRGIWSNMKKKYRYMIPLRVNAGILTHALAVQRKRSETGCFLLVLEKYQPYQMIERFVIEPRPVFARYVSYTYGDRYSIVHRPCNKYHLYCPVESIGILLIIILNKTWERFYNTSFELERKTEIKNTFSTLLNSQNQFRCNINLIS